MTTKTDITPEQRLTIVKHLAGGKDLDITATIMRLDRSTVLDIGSHHGYPSTEFLHRAVGLLEHKIARDNAPTQHPNAAVIEHEQRATRRPAVDASTPAAAGLHHHDDIEVLFRAAKLHSSKRIQAAGSKAHAAVERLRELIRADEQKNAQRRREEAARAAAAAEVERLEAQLRAAKAKLHGGRTSKVAKSVSKPAGGEHACRHTGCGRTFATSQARAMHQRRAHEGFDPNRAHQAAS